DDLGDVVETGLVEVCEQGRDEACARLRLRVRSASADADPRVDERAEQPWPDRALMVGAVALARTALVVADVGGIAGLERAEADRRLQARLDRIDDAPR